jgi:hypothetical protein
MISSNVTRQSAVDRFTPEERTRIERALRLVFGGDRSDAPEVLSDRDCVEQLDNRIGGSEKPTRHIVIDLARGDVHGRLAVYHKLVDVCVDPYELCAPLVIAFNDARPRIAEVRKGVAASAATEGMQFSEVRWDFLSGAAGLFWLITWVDDDDLLYTIHGSIDPATLPLPPPLHLPDGSSYQPTAQL